MVAGLKHARRSMDYGTVGMPTWLRERAMVGAVSRAIVCGSIGRASRLAPLPPLRELGG